MCTSNEVTKILYEDNSTQTDCVDVHVQTQNEDKLVISEMKKN